MSDEKAMLLILVVSLVTIALRFLPFLIFRGKETPKKITYLGKVLPYAIMAMLVVYCLKGVSLVSAPYGAPEMLAVLCVVVLHLWKRNTLLSIAGGTVCYMILLQMVF